MFSSRGFKTIAAVFLLLLLTAGIGAGVYLGVKRQQDIRSKAAGCDMRWPADPNTACGRSGTTPANGATNVSLTPSFHWSYGGYRAGETGCVEPTGCGKYNVEIWLGHGATFNESQVFAKCFIPGPSQSQPNIIHDAAFSCFNISKLQPNTPYFWRVNPIYGDGNWHVPAWAYSFTTGADVPTTPDCKSLTTGADLNNLKIGQAYTFTLTTQGAAPITDAEMSVHSGGVGSCPTDISDLRATDHQHGTGPTFTFTWTPTKTGPFTAFGRVWNDGIAECRADCVDGPPRFTCAGAAACRLTGTVTQATAACQRVVADKDLTKIKKGDTVKFTGTASLTNPAAGDSIDKIKFILFREETNQSVILNGEGTDVNTTLLSDSGGTKVWVATFSTTISDFASYAVQIKAHQVSTGGWLE